MKIFKFIQDIIRTSNYFLVSQVFYSVLPTDLEAIINCYKVCRQFVNYNAISSLNFKTFIDIERRNDFRHCHIKRASRKINSAELTLLIF